MSEPQAVEQSVPAPEVTSAPAASSPPAARHHPAATSAPPTSNRSFVALAVVGIGLVTIAVSIFFVGETLRDVLATRPANPSQQAPAGAHQSLSPAPPAEDQNALVIVRRGALGESTKSDTEAIQTALKKRMLSDSDVAKIRQGNIEKAVDDFFRLAGK